jgi:nitrile hydratase
MQTNEIEFAKAAVVFALGETPIFAIGERVAVHSRSPIGHYRVPRYLRGKAGFIEAIVDPAAVDNEEEAYGRNAGSRLHYYRVVFALKDIWAVYAGSSRDSLAIEIYETWLERA